MSSPTGCSTVFKCRQKCHQPLPQAAFVLAVISDRHPRGQRLAADLGLLPLIRAQLPHATAAAAGRGHDAPAAGLLAQWLALALGKLVEDAPDVRTFFVSNPKSTSKRLYDLKDYEKHRASGSGIASCDQ